MPALSIATSVPVPMAMPTSACASAGASLIPSPAIATTCPSAWSRRTAVALFRRQHVRNHLVDAELRRDGPGVGLVVAGQHHDSEPLRVQQADRLRSRRLDRVRDADEAGGRADRRPRTRPCRRRLAGRPPGLRERPGVTFCSFMSARLPTSTSRPPAVPRMPCPVSDSKARGGAARRRRGRAPPRRRRRPADARSPVRPLPASASTSSSVNGGTATTARHPRLSFRQRAGLVHDQRVDPLEPLERFGVSDQHARAGAPARADHDGHRRRQAERARAGDDQHRNGAHQRVRQPRLGSPERSTPQTRSARRRRQPARTRRRPRSASR